MAKKKVGKRSRKSSRQAKSRKLEVETTESTSSDTQASATEHAGASLQINDTSVDLIQIAAIGASAGGLEPIENFFDSMPADSGCAFVIIQHLSPDFRSLMDELLARHSSMNIHRVTDGMQIEPDSIYLNPPRSVMTIDGNVLRVERIDTQDTVYLPIDLFFNSLAQSRREQAIGLVLSGTGSDGTRGSLAISEVGGKVLVQDPETTRFNGMPKSVVADGNYSLIAPPHDLAIGVVKLINGESLEDLLNTERQPIEEPLQDLLSMLKHRYGTEFEQYKEATIKRRIERRAQMRRISDINDYRDILNTDEAELQELYADLLIEVTEFFRDNSAFDILEQRVIPELMADLKDGEAVRVWVPGCASGEEAYSIAILLQEHARAKGIYLQLKIMATDIHIRSMNQASSGIYSEDALKGMPAELITRYFDIADGQAQIKPTIRNMVFFSTHDVMRDPPFTRIDLISCRNLLIYLKEDAQEKVMNLLHFSLRKNGFLFLGPSEHIGAIAHEFEAVNEKWRIYKKRRDIKLLPSESIFQRADVSKDIAVANTYARNVVRHTATADENTIPFKRAQRSALETIVSRYAPPGFLLTEDGVIVHIFGNAGTLLPLQSGSFSKRIVDLIRADMKVIVTAALDHARSSGFEGFRRTAYVKEENEASSTYEVSLERLDLPAESMRFLLLSIQKQETNSASETERELKAPEFLSHESADALQQRILVLEHSLQSSEESLQSTIEELETSNEELQSTNEELMSTNEELQSTNEELHSVNEELYTVSAEHQRKNEELTERDTDVNMLLQLSKIGTLHLDEDLRLQRYTKKARSLFNIMPQDLGRPFSHITSQTVDHDIVGMVNTVKEKQEVIETELLVNDEVYLLRILPYQRDDKLSRGVLITIIDITDLQEIRTELQSLNEQYKDIVENTDSFIVRWHASSNKIKFCNELYAKRWNAKAEDLIGKDIISLRSKDQQDAFVKIVDEVKIGEPYNGIYRSIDVNGNKNSARIVTKAIAKDGKTISEYQTIGNDFTEEQAYRDSLDRLSNSFSNSDLGPEDKLKEILQIGLDFFQLDTAQVSMIFGQRYRVRTVVSNRPYPYTAGTELDLSDTVCGQFIEKQSTLFIDNIAASELNNLPCHSKSGIESYVGVAIQTASGPYGSVSFFSAKPRKREFGPNEKNFAILVAKWIGFLLGNVEQLEFQEKQTDYYKLLFASVPTILLLADPEGLIISTSNHFSYQVGEKSETIPGRNCLDFIHSDDKEIVAKSLSEGSAQDLPVKMYHSEKGFLDVEMNITVKSIGSLQGIRIITATDVTSRNIALRDSVEKNTRLESANESLNQFAFIASHDLQEPLRKIQQFCSFLEEDLEPVLTEDASFHLNVIVDASQRMSTLIHDLLRYSDTSQAEADMEELDLGEILQEIQVELESSIQQAQATITMKNISIINGNKSLLKQLFTNLISNSLKYRSTERSPKIEIKGIGKDYKEGIVLADNGIGFDMNFSRKIFEPFNRLHNHKEYKGNGIGLAICTTVCEKHGWSLSAEGAPDEGSKFMITFNNK